MSEEQTPRRIEYTNQPQLDEAKQYIEQVRALYRDREGAYAGRRTPDQELIVEIAGEEARNIVDGARSLGSLVVPFGDMVGPKPLPEDYEQHEYVGFTWEAFRGEFERLFVGFGVLTNRLHRDHPEVKDFAELSNDEIHATASVLFSDFLEHNALRFGVEGSGILRSYPRHTEDGEVERVVRDKDIARADRDIKRNMRKREYHSARSQHAAAKLSPDDYRRLRRQYGEVDKDDFDYAASFYQDFEEYLASLGE